MDLTHEIPHLEQTSTARLFVGAWKLDQHISPIEARNDLARSVVINVPTCSKESPDNIGKLKKPSNIGCTRKENKLRDSSRRN